LVLVSLVQQVATHALEMSLQAAVVRVMHQLLVVRVGQAAVVQQQVWQALQTIGECRAVQFWQVQEITAMLVLLPQVAITTQLLAVLVAQAAMVFQVAVEHYLQQQVHLLKLVATAVQVLQVVGLVEHKLLLELAQVVRAAMVKTFLLVQLIQGAQEQLAQIQTAQAVVVQE
jgi:hypothetical protein